MTCWRARHRWDIKYAAGNYGNEKICDYFADIAVNQELIANPARRWYCGYSRTTPSTGYRASLTPTCATETNTS